LSPVPPILKPAGNGGFFFRPDVQVWHDAKACETDAKVRARSVLGSGSRGGFSSAPSHNGCRCARPSTNHSFSRHARSLVVSASTQRRCGDAYATGQSRQYAWVLAGWLRFRVADIDRAGIAAIRAAGQTLTANQRDFSPAPVQHEIAMGAPGIEPATSDSAAVTEFEREDDSERWAGRRSERHGADATRPGCEARTRSSARQDRRNGQLIVAGGV
jgi:hypothetical protein